MRKRKTPLEIVSIVLLGLASLAAVLPFILLIVSSFADNNTLIKEGYSFFPSKLSMAAYNYLRVQGHVIFRAYSITIIVTVLGTVVSLAISSMLAYVLSRKDFPMSRVITFIVFFTMLFNGGLVPTYLLYASYLKIKNTIWALMMPMLLMNGFNVLIMRTYYRTNVPGAVIESAIIDGAGEFRIFMQIVMPLSVPIIATIGLFVGIAYWNDWFNGLIYLTKPSLFNIQNLLNRILMNVQFLSTTTVGSDASAAISKLPTVSVRMAIAVIGILPVLIAYPFFQKYFVKGLVVGAVKG